jgi:hypothetical protein
MRFEELEIPMYFCPLKRRPLMTRRRGSLVVTSFMFVIALMVVFAGITTVLKEQLRQSLDVKTISIGRIQVYYLAEMGLNDAMFWANQSPVAPVWPANGAVVDFTSRVEMVRGTSGFAKCTYIQQQASPPLYQVQATLQVPGDPTIYSRAVSFGAAFNGSQWTLSSFAVVK